MFFLFCLRVTFQNLFLYIHRDVFDQHQRKKKENSPTKITLLSQSSNNIQMFTQETKCKQKYKWKCWNVSTFRNNKYKHISNWVNNNNNQKNSVRDIGLYEWLINSVQRKEVCIIQRWKFNFIVHIFMQSLCKVVCSY